MTQDFREKLVGAVTLVSLSVLVALMNSGGDVRGAEADDLKIRAMFGKADGLRPGAPVQIAGVQVGVVHDMELDEKFRAIVTLSLNPDLQLPDDTEASIETDGLFGGKFVKLRIGFEDVLLESGDLITRNYDAQIVGDLLEQIISEGQANLAQRKAEKEAAREGTGSAIQN